MRIQIVDAGSWVDYIAPLIKVSSDEYTLGLFSVKYNGSRWEIIGFGSIFATSTTSDITSSYTLDTWPDPIRVVLY